MKFSEKIKKVMQELNLNQLQLAGITGKSRASISQYLSDKQIPTIAAQQEMAVALGRDKDYFISQAQKTSLKLKQEPDSYMIQKLDVMTVSRLMGMNHVTVRKGLQQGVFPWGYAIHTSENRWTYFINAKSFAEIEHVSLEEIA